MPHQVSKPLGTKIGWLVRVTTLNSDGHPAIYQNFLVFEPNKKLAAQMARIESVGSESQVVEILAPIDPGDIEACGLRSGQARSICAIERPSARPRSV